MKVMKYYFQKKKTQFLLSNTLKSELINKSYTVLG